MEVLREGPELEAAQRPPLLQLLELARDVIADYDPANEKLGALLGVHGVPRVQVLARAIVGMFSCLDELKLASAGSLARVDYGSIPLALRAGDFARVPDSTMQDAVFMRRVAAALLVLADIAEAEAS